MERITQKDLERLCDVLNDVRSFERKPYDQSKPGCNPNPNVYHLDYGYGGVKLAQMMPTGTGVRDIFSGYAPKRELYNEIGVGLNDLHRFELLRIILYRIELLRIILYSLSIYWMADILIKI